MQQRLHRWCSNASAHTATDPYSRAERRSSEATAAFVAPIAGPWEVQVLPIWISRRPAKRHYILVGRIHRFYIDTGQTSLLPEHVSPSILEVRTGPVSVRTRYLLRGGNGARALARVGFKTCAARDAAFSRRPVADQNEDDKFEEHTYIVNVCKLYPFGWGKAGSGTGSAERTFRTKTDAEHFKMEVDAAIRNADPLKLHGLLGDRRSTIPACGPCTRAELSSLLNTRSMIFRAYSLSFDP